MTAPINKIITRRMNRQYKSKERGSKSSYLHQVENTQIMLAWSLGLLSEGQASKALGVDRVEARKMFDESTQLGEDLGRALYARSKR